LAHSDPILCEGVCHESRCIERGVEAVCHLASVVGAREHLRGTEEQAPYDKVPAAKW